MMNNTNSKLTVLVTAGPTREAIDPVRYITNHFSGKMGYALAVAFLEMDCKVILVSGPVNLSLDHPELLTIPVNTADEMYNACQPYFERVEIAVFAAAVADYRPAEIQRFKMKKSGDSINLEMIKNVDIAAEFGKIKTIGQVSVGFALETDDEEQNAIKKLHSKNLDMVVLNSVNDKNSSFGHDTNKVTIFNRNLVSYALPLKNKKDVGRDIARAAVSISPRRIIHSVIADYH